jgi:predicted lipid carrier protein YhbT
LGRWGGKSLAPPQEGEFVPVNSLALALRAAFRAPARHERKRRYELRIDGTSIRVRVDGTHATVPDTLPGPADVVIEANALDVTELLMGRLDIDTAMSSARVRVDGDVADARHFFELFQLAEPATT